MHLNANTKILEYDKYSIFRKGQPSRKGGGVAILVDKRFYTMLIEITGHDDYEKLWVAVSEASDKAKVNYVVGCYIIRPKQPTKRLSC